MRELHSIADNIDLLKGTEIFIYGDGLYGSMTCRYLSCLGIRAASVLVSDIAGKQELFHGVPVEAFEAEKQRIRGNTVILAMSEKHAGTVQESVLACEPAYIVRVSGDLYQEMLRYFYSSLPIVRNKLFVSCFFGKGGFRDNPRAVVEEIFRRKKTGDPIAGDIDIVWELADPEGVSMPEGIRVVKEKTEEYYRELNSAGVILINDYPGINGLVKKEQQFIVNTWHGTGPFKTVYNATADFPEEERERLKKDISQTDAMICAAKQYHDAYQSAFLYHGTIYDYGYPRNDVLLRDAERKACWEKIRSFYGIRDTEKIVLYAPTFRHNGQDGFGMYDLGMDQVLSALEKRFGSSFRLLYRYHHVLWHDLKREKKFADGIDATDYPDIMDLLAAADVLITDYSSCMWDFSLMYRPVFLYHKDISEYEDDRGFFWPPERWPYPRAHSTEEMCDEILHFDEDAYHRALDRFFEEDPSYDDGHASERVVDLIEDVMVHPEKYGKA